MIPRKAGGVPVRFTAVISACFALLMLAADAAAANVVAKISISQQTMEVVVNGRTAHRWAVSTGAGRARTPTGTFRPIRMHRQWYSRRYNNAPMPHSIFFYKGYAIHGTDQISRLGRPASKGCIRLHPKNAAALFALVRQHGPGKTRIVITR
jgi:lipoprotein-anchoring transpeptidase ErfK/SrfK